MWIKFKNEATDQFYDPEIMDDRITTTGNYTANVPDGVGEQLIEKYPDGVEEYEDADEEEKENVVVEPIEEEDEEEEDTEE